MSRAMVMDLVVEAQSVQRMSRKKRIPRMPASLLQKADWFLEVPMVRLHPATQEEKPERLGDGTRTIAKLPCSTSLQQDLSPTAAADPVVTASAKSWYR